MPDESDGGAKSAHTSHPDGLKGQKMVIYMPAGAVIVERIDVDEHVQPVEVISKHANSDEYVQPVGAVSPGHTNTEEHQILYRVAKILDVITERTTPDEHSKPVGVASRNADELQILFRIAKILDVITERLSLSQDVQSVGVASQLTDAHEQVKSVALSQPVANDDDNIHGPKRHHVDWGRRHHVDWMHFINFAFVAYIACVSVIPPVLSAYFDTAVYAATSSIPGATIYRGDLMVSKFVPVSKLNVNDVVLLRDEHTWNLKVRKVQDISTLGGGALTTITTGSDLGAASRNSYTLNSATRIHKVTSVIAGIGSLSIIVTSIFVKIGGGLFILTLNIIVHIRRVRRRSLNAN